MSDKNGIAQIGQPVQLTWRNRRVRTKENEKGEFFYFVEFEFNEEDFGYLKTIPRNADGEMMLWITDIGLVVEKPKRKPKEPKGPYSYMWEYLNPNSKHGGAGFHTLPGVKEAIEAARISADTADVWPILHRVFGHCHTLAIIGPDDVLAKFPDNQPVQIAVERAMNFQRDKENNQ